LKVQTGRRAVSTSKTQQSHPCIGVHCSSRQHA